MIHADIFIVGIDFRRMDFAAVAAVKYQVNGFRDMHRSAFDGIDRLERNDIL